ncbi:MAG: EAL domain-containing protein [Hyphomicrobium sp.]
MTTSVSHLPKPGKHHSGPSDPFAGEAGKGASAHLVPPAADAGPLRDGIVFAMMAVVAAAAGGILHMQFGYSGVASVLAAAGAWVGFMVIHALATRAGEVNRLHSEIATLEHELARIKTHGAAATGRNGAPGPADSRATWSQGPKAAELQDARDNRQETARPVPGRPDVGRQESRPDSRRGAVAAPETSPVMSPAAGAINAPAPQAGSDTAIFSQNPITTEARWETAPAVRRTRLVPATPEAGPAAASAAPPAPYNAPRQSSAQSSAQSIGTSYAPVQANASSSPAANTRDAARRADLVDVPTWSGTAVSQGDPLRDAWSFRSSEAPESHDFAAEASAGDAAARPSPARTIEADLEMVQRKIKALADEVNATEALKIQSAVEATQGEVMEDSIAVLKSTAGRMRAQRATSPAAASRQQAYNDAAASMAHQPPPGRQSASKLPSPSAPVSPYESAEPARSPQAAQTSPPAQQLSQPSGAMPSGGALPSLDMLIPATAQPIAVSPQPSARAQQAAPEAQRALQPAPVPAAVPASPKVPEPVAHDIAAQHATERAVPAAQNNRRAPAVDRRLAEIADAIGTSRMDVYLNPIVGLGDYAVTHFEVAVRLKASNGEYIDNPEQTLSLGASDLLALFDIERLNRTALLAAQLEARGKQGSLLSPTAGQSMTDGEFLEAFARTFESRTSISGQLVLTFTQADIAAFGPGTWQALADMHSFGFRFALEQVTHLGTDFAALGERGFAFVKLPASAFLEGLPAGHGMVPPADICRHLASAGLTLVVEAINDDAVLGRVFGFGALFGQGRLFGGSRQISLDGLGEARTAAA